jgi:hypothetical protein
VRPIDEHRAFLSAQPWVCKKRGPRRRAKTRG